MRCYRVRFKVSVHWELLANLQFAILFSVWWIGQRLSKSTFRNIGRNLKVGTVYCSRRPVEIMVTIIMVSCSISTGEGGGEGAQEASLPYPLTHWSEKGPPSPFFLSKWIPFSFHRKDLAETTWKEGIYVAAKPAKLKCDKIRER